MILGQGKTTGRKDREHHGSERWEKMNEKRRIYANRDIAVADAIRTVCSPST